MAASVKVEQGEWPCPSGKKDARPIEQSEERNNAQSAFVLVRFSHTQTEHPLELLEVLIVQYQREY